jgi:hypothetical protein
MFLRPHIAAETLGVVPPLHHLEDAGPGDIPPGLQMPETWAFSTRCRRSRNEHSRIPPLSGKIVTSLLTTKPRPPSWPGTPLSGVIMPIISWLPNIGAANFFSGQPAKLDLPEILK